ncbi:MAG: PAS domain S-box protein [Chloroflexi bacterium]|nr:PAS domain S-box protein [Chloroflexota bacterium]
MSAEREIGYVSPTYPKFLGYTPQEMVGHFGMEYVYPEDLPFTTKAFRELLQTPAGKVIVEYRLQRKDGSYCWVETTAVNLLADPYVQAVVLNQRDISERKQAEVAQHDSEERYRTLAEATFEAIVITENGLILDVNKQFLQMLGYEMTEILGRHLSEIFIPEEVDFLRKLIASGKEMVREYTIIKKDGMKIPIEAHGREIEHSQRRLRLTTIRDFTERKLAREQLEESLQQQHLLSKHLQTIRETERAAVAREIHDELGQALTGLKMELYLIKDMQAKATDAEEARIAQRLFQQVAEKLTAAVQDVDATIDVVRNISTSLRPSLLDTLGLVPALEWLAQEFQIRSGIPCSFTAGLKQQDFSQEFSTAAFRICQEALTNVTRHAQASRVKISFKSKKADILLEVEDDGCGINVEKERAYAFNGSVELKNSRTGGGRVMARFPAFEVLRSDH